MTERLGATELSQLQENKMKYEDYIEQIQGFSSLYEKLKEKFSKLPAGKIANALNIQFGNYRIPLIESKADFLEVLEILEEQD